MNDSSRSRSLCDISFRVNGQATKVHVHPMERLLDVLRHELGLTGTKEGCGEGECGSCCILMDGKLVNSCLIPALQATNAELVTIEGLAGDGRMHVLQQAFLDHGGAQCGMCTPGMILAATYLLDKHPQPTPDEIRDALAGNLCRCTGYLQIVEAVVAAARRDATT